MWTILLYVNLFLTIRGNPKNKNFIYKSEYDQDKMKYFLMEKPFPKNNNIWKNQALQREYLLAV